MKKWIIGILLIALITGLWAGINSGNAGPSSGKHDTISPEDSNNRNRPDGGTPSGRIILNTSLPEIPEKVLVYKTVPPNISRISLEEYAKKFNITDSIKIKDNDEKIIVSSENLRKRVMLFKNGGRYYIDYDRSDTPNGIDIAENLPTDNDAEKIATNFLKERGLFPEGAKIGGTEHRRVYRSSNYNKSETIVWEDILVYYTREINGMKVEGTQFEVEVGGRGDIIRFFSNWKDYQPIGEYSIITQNSSMNSLRQKGIATTSGPDMPDTISINEVYLAYYTTAVADKENYLEPVYVFKGRH